MMMTSHCGTDEPPWDHVVKEVHQRQAPIAMLKGESNGTSENRGARSQETNENLQRVDPRRAANR
eukprot:5809671-Prorocentrum_lima.AAC.1